MYILREEIYIIDSRTHRGPAVIVGSSMTKEYLLHQAKTLGIGGIPAFPFCCQGLADDWIDHEVFGCCQSIAQYISCCYISDDLGTILPGGAFRGYK